MPWVPKPRAAGDIAPGFEMMAGWPVGEHPAKGREDTTGRTGGLLRERLEVVFDE